VLIDDGRARNAGNGTVAGMPAPAREALAGAIEPVIAAHRRLWLERNRPGGLSDSVAWLERLRDNYRKGDVDPAWLVPGLRPVPPAD
jgi:hypothetical protein